MTSHQTRPRDRPLIALATGRRICSVTRRRCPRCDRMISGIAMLVQWGAPHTFSTRRGRMRRKPETFRAYHVDCFKAESVEQQALGIEPGEWVEIIPPDAGPEN